MLEFLKLKGEFLRKYWVGLVIVLALSVCVAVKLSADAQIRYWQKEIAASEQRHAEEIKKIDVAHDTQVKEREANLKKLQEQLDAVQVEYDKAKHDLAVARATGVKKILDETKDDPNELAKKLSDATGIPISK